MPFPNQGVPGGTPTLYFPIGTDSEFFNRPFLVDGDQILIPADMMNPAIQPGKQYNDAHDQKWSFTFQDIGNDVDTSLAINDVTFSVFAWLPPFKRIRPYYYFGGTKYYLWPTSFVVDGPPYNPFGTESNPFDRPNGNYGNGPQWGFFTFPQGFLWRNNPATNAPWVLTEITGGEFGFETDAANQHDPDGRDYIKVYGLFLEIFWGNPVTGGGPGGAPLPAPCGQTTTLRGAWTNYGPEILTIRPKHGPLTGGTRVTITGVNFIDGCTVTFGGSEATGVVFVDSEHYIAVTPNHPIGFVDVVINEPSGTPVILRNGFQYTLFTRGVDIRRSPAVNIRRGLNQGSNTASFSIDGDSNPPKAGEQIQLIDEEQDPRRLLFAGNVQRVNQEYEGQTNQLVWRCDAVDYTWLLNRRRPFGTYERVSASEIVKDLINRYAPGFTTNFVQTNLAKISVFFDGSQDLITCLTIVARMIGGGHWYCDFNQDVHFFHVVPPNVNMPALPNFLSGTTASPTVSNPTVSGTGSNGVGIVQIPQPGSGAPSTAVTATQSAALFSTGFTWTPGFLTFRVTFLYDDGLESALGPCSSPVGFDGRHKHVLSNIPLGVAVGGRNVVKRRIYVIVNGTLGGSSLYGYAQINDNTTTSITKDNVLFTPASAIDMLTVTPPTVPFVPAPNYSSPQPPAVDVTNTPITDGQPEYRPVDAGTITFSEGNYRFRISNIYQDGTESKMGPESNSITLNGTKAASMTNIPLGAAIEGVTVIARRIWGAYGPLDTDFFPWWLIPNNTDTAVAAFWPTTSGWQTNNPPGGGGGQPPPGPPDEPPSENPVWPNDDGPFLEDFDLPDPVTDDNPDLLRDPQVSSQVDTSQLRNRIMIRGAGATLAVFTARGATQLDVTDTWYYSEKGGQIFVEGAVLDYTGRTTSSGPGKLNLRAPSPEDFNAGAPVSLYLVVEDKKSQASVGAIEVDKNGNPTDGIHEFTITDSSLETPFQMFMRGNAELELYARPIVSVSYATRDAKSRPGAKVQINLTSPPIVGEFLIVDVTIDQFHDEADILLPRYNVSTSSAKFDLNDLFFQWSSNHQTPTVPPNTPPPPPATPPGVPPGPPTDPRDPPPPPGGGGSDPPAQAFTRPVYIGQDIPSGTTRNWVNSHSLFALYADTLVPSPAPANRTDSPDNTKSNRAFSMIPSAENTFLGMLWVGPYTRGQKQPIYFLDRFLTYALLREVPLDPDNGQSYVGSTGAIVDWSPNADGSKVYFASQDYLKGSATSFSRIMQFDFSNYTISQVGQGCSQDALPITPTPLGDGNNAFNCILCTPSNELYAGVGTAFTGFNSFYTGVYKLIGNTWTSVLNLEATQPTGETPHTIAFHDGRIYVGTGRIITGSAVGAPSRIHMSPNGGISWVVEVEFGSAADDVVDRIIGFGDTVYATTYSNLATDLTKIWRRTSAGVWETVATIDTGANPMRGIDMITVGPGNGGLDDTLLVLCLDSGANAKVMSTRNGTDWTSSQTIAGLTSNFGALKLPPV